MKVKWKLILLCVMSVHTLVSGCILHPRQFLISPIFPLWAPDLLSIPPHFKLSYSPIPSFLFVCPFVLAKVKFYLSLKIRLLSIPGYLVFFPLGNVNTVIITIDLHFCTLQIEWMEQGDSIYLKLSYTPPLPRNMDPSLLPGHPPPNLVLIPRPWHSLLI